MLVNHVGGGLTRALPRCAVVLALVPKSFFFCFPNPASFSARFIADMHNTRVPLVLVPDAITKGGQHRLTTIDSVSLRFTQQLSELMAQLQATEPQFVRCVKPNKEQVPNFVDSKFVMHQLRYMGVLETVKVRPRCGCRMVLCFARALLSGASDDALSWRLTMRLDVV